MQLSGAYTFNAPSAKVWTALTDPIALSNCIPGCQSMEATGDNQYKAAVTFALGPISGRYNATISMSEMSTHQSFRLSVQANGPLGFADGRRQARYSTCSLRQLKNRSMVVLATDPIRR